MEQKKEYWFDLGPLNAIPLRGARTVQIGRAHV